MPGDRSGLLAGIQKAGGIGALKKVDRTKIRDRSGAAVPGGSDSGPAGSGLPPGGDSGGADGGLANALALALDKRKKKVSASGKSRHLDLKSSLANFEQTMKRTMMIGKRLTTVVKSMERVVITTVCPCTATIEKRIEEGRQVRSSGRV